MGIPKFSDASPTTAEASSPLLALGAAVRQNATGQLRLQTGKIIRQFQWNSGQCMNIASNAKSELPGTFLFKEGKMSQDQYDKFLLESKKPKVKLWETAAQITSLSTDDLRTLRKKHALQIINGMSMDVTVDVRFQPAPSNEDAKPILPGTELLLAAVTNTDPGLAQRLCPELTPSAHIHFDPIKEADVESAGLIPELKGLVTVVRDNDSIGGVFESSFLDPDRITRALLAFWLAGWITLERAEAAARRKHEKKLSADQQAARRALLDRVDIMKTPNYYEWLSIPPDSDTASIQAAANALTETYAAPSLEAALYTDEKPLQDEVLKKIREALSILSDDIKRKEYDGFLRSGSQDSFLDTSVTVREEEVLRNVEQSLKEKKKVGAIAALEKGIEEVPSSGKLVAEYTRLLLSLDNATQPSIRDKALRELKRALNLKPPIPAVYESLGAWMSALGQNEKASEVYRRALDLAPFSQAARDGYEKLDRPAAIRAQLKAIHRHIGDFNLYELLGTEPGVNVKSIQIAYRDCTRRFHPDRFFRFDDQELKELAKTIYKRMVAAYMTLKNPTKRKAYDDRLTS